MMERFLRIMRVPGRLTYISQLGKSRQFDSTRSQDACPRFGAIFLDSLERSREEICVRASLL